MVVDGDNGVFIRLSHGPDGVGHTFLHLGIGPLYGIQFDGMAELARGHRRNGTATHADAVVVAPQNDDDVPLFGLPFLCIFGFGKTDTACQHDHFVVAVSFIALLMFECQQAAIDQRLSEFVAEVGGTIGSFDQYFFRIMIEPFAGLDTVFPFLAFILTPVRGHIHRCSRQRPAGFSACQTVADFATAPRRGSVKGFNGCREVMSFRFQRQNGIDVFDLKKIRFVLCGRRKLFDLRPYDKSHIVFIGRNQVIRIFFGGFFDQGKQALFHLFPVNDESSVKDFVAAVFRIYLGKAVNLGIGQFTTYFPAHLFKVFHLIIAEGQPLIRIVCSDVFHLPDRFGHRRDLKNLFIQPVVQLLQHRVVRSFFVVHFVKCLYPLNTFNTHILRDLHGIRTPWRNHFFTRADKKAAHMIAVKGGGTAEKPGELFQIVLR